jgi:DNA-binding response OmpR family regulator
LDAVTVLLVEDDQLVRLMAEEALREAGFEVALAGSAEEAVALLDGQSPGFRAVVTDVELSPAGLSGWDVARRARELVPDMPVVYMTGGRANDWAAQGVPKSVLLVKRFVPGQLVTAVTSLLNVVGSAPLEDGA